MSEQNRDQILHEIIAEQRERIEVLERYIVETRQEEDDKPNLHWGFSAVDVVLGVVAGAGAFLLYHAEWDYAALFAAVLLMGLLGERLVEE